MIGYGLPTEMAMPQRLAEGQGADVPVEDSPVNGTSATVFRLTDCP